MEDVNCLICGHDKAKQLFRSQSYVYLQQVFALTQCTECGLVFLNPRPTGKEMEEYYKNYYPPMYLENLERLNHFLRSILLHVEIGQTKYETISDSKNNKFLEIGFGDGFFPEYIKSKGWDVWGVEVNQGCVDRFKRKGYQSVFCGDVFSQAFDDESFDLIRMNHVLEHMYDPVDVLREVKRILKKNGRIILTVPNFNGYGHQLFKQYAYYLHLPYHVYFFSQPILERLIDRVEGLRVVKVYKTHFFAFYISSIIQFLRSNKQRVYHLPSSSANRMVMRRLLDLVPARLMSILNILGEGDVMELEIIKGA